MKLNRWLWVVVAAAAGGLMPAAALSVTCEAGGLRQAVGNETDAVSLIVSGEINAADFDFIAFEMTGVDNLDLSGAQVVAYEGEPTFTGRTSSLANVLPDGALMSVKATTIHLPSTLGEIGAGALADAAVKTLVLPRYLKTIGESAFSNARNLESIVVPESVEHLGKGAFKDCPSLKSVEIKGPIEAVKQQTFKGCDALTTVILPKSVTLIASDAFAGCRSLEIIDFPSSLVTIGQGAFYGAGLRNVDLAHCAGLEEVGDWAFAANGNLAEVGMPPSLRRIGKGAFFNNTSMALHRMPGSLEKIDDFALRGIKSAPADVISGTRVTDVGDFALARWRGVSKFYLPSGLERLGDGAMANWSGLYAISAEWVADIPLLGQDVWRGVKQSNVILAVPEGKEDAYASAPQWQDFMIKGVTPGGVDASESPVEGVVARFEGMTLHLSAPVEIAGADLFGIDGRSYAMAAGGGTTSLAIDTSAWDVRVLVVRLRLTDGRIAALKLWR